MHAEEELSAKEHEKLLQEAIQHAEEVFKRKEGEAASSDPSSCS
jgi:hypothetical protein